MLIPCALVVAGLPVAAGRADDLGRGLQATTLEGARATIARSGGGAADEQLGTIGGGFFGRSAHPMENPGPWSNLLQVVAIILLPMAAIVAFGVMSGMRADAAVIFGVMLVPTVAGAVLAVQFERGPNRAAAGLPVAADPTSKARRSASGRTPRRLGRRSRPPAPRCGSRDPRQLPSPQQPGRAALMLLNAAFSGVGSGFLHMLLYIVVAVFLGGLMVGRTPEYLGRKLEAREMKMAMIAPVAPPPDHLRPGGPLRGDGLGTIDRRQSRAAWIQRDPLRVRLVGGHERLGLRKTLRQQPAVEHRHGDRDVPRPLSALILPLAIAGSLARKPRLPLTFGTLRTDDLTFAGLLLGTMLLVGALSFLPPAVLGPVADFLARPPS